MKIEYRLITYLPPTPCERSRFISIIGTSEYPSEASERAPNGAAISAGVRKDPHRVRGTALGGSQDRQKGK